MAIKRQTLRAQIREELLRRLAEGTIDLHDGINEAQLAAELGVSRTPLREALIALETEGSIASEFGKGFKFNLVSAEEFAEMAPIIGHLECLAIELTPAAYLKKAAPQLVKMSKEFSSSQATHREVIDHDEKWHKLLTAGCTNQRLLSLLDSLKSAAHRFEFEVVPSDAMVSRVAEEHLSIAEHLAAGELEQAQAALRENWVNGLARIVVSEPDPVLTRA